MVNFRHVLSIQDQFSPSLDKWNRGTREARANAEGFSSSLGGLNVGFGVVAAGAAAFAAKFISSFAEVEQRLKELQVVTTTTTQSIDQAMQTSLERARAFASEFAFSTAEVIGASFELASAGLNVEETIEGIEQAAFLASAGLGDLRETAILMGQAFNTVGQTGELQFLSPLEKARRIADSTAVAVKKFQITLPVLAEGLKFTVGPAAQLGISLDELNATLGTLNTAGLRGSLAGTALSQTLTKIGDATNKLGLDPSKFTDAAGGLTSLADVLAEVERNLPTGKQARFNALVEAFDIRAARAVVALIDNVDALRQNTRELENANGAAEDFARIIGSGLQQQLKVLGNNLSSVGQTLVRELVESFRGVVNLATSLASAFQRIPKPILAFIGAVVLAAAKVLLVEAAFQSLIVVGRGLAFLFGQNILSATARAGGALIAWAKGVDVAAVKQERLAAEAVTLESVLVKLDATLTKIASSMGIASASTTRFAASSRTASAAQAASASTAAQQVQKFTLLAGVIKTGLLVGLFSLIPLLLQMNSALSVTGATANQVNSSFEGIGSAASRTANDVGLLTRTLQDTGKGIGPAETAAFRSLFDTNDVKGLQDEIRTLEERIVDFQTTSGKQSTFGTNLEEIGQDVRGFFLDIGTAGQGAFLQQTRSIEFLNGVLRDSTGEIQRTSAEFAQLRAKILSLTEAEIVERQIKVVADRLARISSINADEAFARLSEAVTGFRGSLDEASLGLTIFQKRFDEALQRRDIGLSPAQVEQFAANVDNARTTLQRLSEQRLDFDDLGEARRQAELVQGAFDAIQTNADQLSETRVGNEVVQQIRGILAEADKLEDFGNVRFGDLDQESVAALSSVILKFDSELRPAIRGAAEDAQALLQILTEEAGITENLVGPAEQFRSEAELAEDRIKKGNAGLEESIQLVSKLERARRAEVDLLTDAASDTANLISEIENELRLGKLTNADRREALELLDEQRKRQAEITGQLDEAKSTLNSIPEDLATTLEIILPDSEVASRIRALQRSGERIPLSFTLRDEAITRADAGIEDVRQRIRGIQADIERTIAQFRFKAINESEAKAIIDPLEDQIAELEERERELNFAKSRIDPEGLDTQALEELKNAGIDVGLSNLIDREAFSKDVGEALRAGLEAGDPAAFTESLGSSLRSRVFEGVTKGFLEGIVRTAAAADVQQIAERIGRGIAAGNVAGVNEDFARLERALTALGRNLEQVGARERITELSGKLDKLFGSVSETTRGTVELRRASEGAVDPLGESVAGLTTKLQQATGAERGFIREIIALRQGRGVVSGIDLTQAGLNEKIQAAVDLYERLGRSNVDGSIVSELTKEMDKLNALALGAGESVDKTAATRPRAAVDSAPVEKARVDVESLRDNLAAIEDREIEIRVAVVGGVADLRASIEATVAAAAQLGVTFDSIGDAGLGSIANQVSSAIDGVGELGDAFRDSFDEVSSIVDSTVAKIAALRTSFDSVAASAKDVAGDAVSQLERLADSTPKSIDELASLVGESDLAKGANEELSSAFETLVQKADDFAPAIERIVAVAETLSSSSDGLASALAGGLAPSIVQVGGSASSALGFVDAFTGGLRFLEEVAQATPAAFRFVVAAAREMVRDATPAILDFADVFLTAIDSTVQGVADGIAFLRDLFRALGQTINDATAGLREGLGDLADVFFDLAGTIETAAPILEAISPAFADLAPDPQALRDFSSDLDNLSRSLEVDTSGLDSGVDRTQEKVDQFREKSKALRDELESGLGRVAGDQEANLRQMADASEEVSRRFEAGRAAFADGASNLGAFGEAMGEVRRDLSDLGAEFSAQGEAVAELDRRYITLETSARKFVATADSAAAIELPELTIRSSGIDDVAVNLEGIEPEVRKIAEALAEAGIRGGDLRDVASEIRRNLTAEELTIDFGISGIESVSALIDAISGGVGFLGDLGASKEELRELSELMYVLYYSGERFSQVDFSNRDDLATIASNFRSAATAAAILSQRAKETGEARFDDLSASASGLAKTLGTTLVEELKAADADFGATSDDIRGRLRELGLSADEARSTFADLRRQITDLEVEQGLGGASQFQESISKIDLSSIRDQIAEIGRLDPGFDASKFVTFESSEALGQFDQFVERIIASLAAVSPEISSLFGDALSGVDPTGLELASIPGLADILRDLELVSVAAVGAKADVEAFGSTGAAEEAALGFADLALAIGDQLVSAIEAASGTDAAVRLSLLPPAPEQIAAATNLTPLVGEGGIPLPVSPQLVDFESLLASVREAVAASPLVLPITANVEAFGLDLQTRLDALALSVSIDVDLEAAEELVEILNDDVGIVGQLEDAVELMQDLVEGAQNVSDILASVVVGPGGELSVTAEATAQEVSVDLGETTVSITGDGISQEQRDEILRRVQEQLDAKLEEIRQQLDSVITGGF